MANVDDIDTKAVVNRFLQRQVITPVNDDEADKDEEVTAVLESVALAFQLQPQMALDLLLLAKNSLQQIVQMDLDLLDFLATAIGDIDNPNPTVDDLSDLIEAQTALLELDRLQRVSTSLQAFQRYTDAINRFLDDQLASALKRKGKKEFERTGTEARTDIFSVLPQFGPTHNVMISRLATLATGIENFRSVSLDKLVSQGTLSRVRDSISAIKDRFENDNISITTAAVELLGGAAAMEAVSTTKDILDSVIQTGTFPANRAVFFQAEPSVKALASSSEGPWTLGGAPWDFKMTLNAFALAPTTVDEELPAVGHEGKVYMVGSVDSPTFDIPVDGTLYLLVEGSVRGEQEVPLTTSGAAVPVDTIISELNALLLDVTAARWNNTNRIALFGAAGVVTSLVFRPGSSGVVGPFAGGALVLIANPVATDTVTIGVKTYTFQAGLTDVDGNVKLGGSASGTLDNLVAAINLDAGAGSTYAASMTLNVDVTAEAGAGDSMDVTAKLHGGAPNGIATTVLMPISLAGDWEEPVIGGGGEGNFLDNPTLHDQLGFSVNQTSLPLGEFTALSLADALTSRVPKATFTATGKTLQVISNLEDTKLSSVRFDGGIEAGFGLAGLAEAAPTYLALVEDGQEINPEADGLFVGTTVTVTEASLAGSARRALNNEAVTEIVEGTQIRFGTSDLPRDALMNVSEAKAPAVQTVIEMRTQLAPFVTAFDNDFDDLRQKMSPIISNPTKAQVNDALSLLADIRARLVSVQDVLTGVVVRADRSQFKGSVDRILQALEGRGLDRAKDLLSSGDFSSFFELSKADASRANRFMTSMEAMVTTDMPVSTLEEDINDDVRSVATNDETALDPTVIPSEEEALVPDLL